MAMMPFRPRPRDACLTLPASTPPPAVGPVAPPIAPAPCRFMLPATAPNPPEPAAAEVPATAPTPPAAAVPEARVAPAADAAIAPNPSVVHHTGPKLRRAARSRSSSSAWASGCRSLGSLAMARSTTGCRSSPRLPVAVGSVAPGSWAIPLSRAPTEYTSLAGVSCSPANASGLAYAPMPAASGWPSQAANSTSFGVPSAVDQDGARRHAAVHDAVPVRVRQTLEGAAQHAESLRHGELGVRRSEHGEAGPVDPFLDQPDGPLVGGGRVRLDDVRVPQAARGLGLGDDPRVLLRTGQRELLEGDVAAVVWIVSLPDRPVPTAGNLVDQGKTTDVHVHTPRVPRRRYRLHGWYSGARVSVADSPNRYAGRGLSATGRRAATTGTGRRRTGSGRPPRPPRRGRQRSRRTPESPRRRCSSAGFR